MEPKRPANTTDSVVAHAGPGLAPAMDLEPAPDLEEWRRRCQVPKLPRVSAQYEQVLHGTAAASQESTIVDASGPSLRADRYLVHTRRPHLVIQVG